MDFDDLKLKRWESQFSSLLRTRQVRLLWEISLTEEEVEAIEQEVKRLIRNRSVQHAHKILTRKFPATFVVYLAHKAAHNPERSFWQYLACIFHVKESAFYRPHWGKAFIEILKHFNLEVIPNVSFRYVQNIRFHGGIPVYSLPDFFEHVVLPSIEDPRYRDLSDAEALHIITQRTEFKYFVDQPVKILLQDKENGLKWFAHAREAVRRIQKGEPLHDLDLPAYVWDALIDYLNHREDRLTQQQYRRGWRRPQLYYDGDHYFLVRFPAQRIRYQQAALRYRWRLTIGEQVFERQVRVSWKGSEAWLGETEERIECLPHLDPQIIVVLEALRISDQEQYWEPIRRWQLKGTAYQVPLMAFRYHNGRTLLPATSLPKETCWLLVPEGCHIKFPEGEKARIVEDIAVLPNGWKGAAYDLHPVSAVIVCNQLGQPLGRIPLKEKRWPKLQGKLLSPSPSGFPWYIGQAPDLLLPLQPTERYLSPQNILDKWHIRLQSGEQAYPKGEWNTSDFIVGAEVIEQDDLPWLRVKMSSILTHETSFTAGVFHLECSKARQFSWSASFVVWPALKIQELHPCYSPSVEGHPSRVTFLLLVQGDVQAAQEGIKVLPKGEGIVKVQVAPDLYEASLHLSLPRCSIQAVPLRLPLPKPRWRLIGRDDLSEWSVRRLRVSLDKFLAHLKPSHEIRLELEMPCYEALKKLQFRLYDLENKDDEGVWHRISGEELPRRGSSVYLDLGRFADDLRKAKQNAEVHFLGLEACWRIGEEEHRALLVEFVRGIKIEKAELVRRSDGVWIHWYEPNPSRHRRLFLWSRWHPWNPPKDVPLPDNAEPGSAPGWWMARLEKDGGPIGLPPGKYNFLFVVALPWERVTPPSSPPSDHPSLLTSQTVTVEERLNTITRLLEKATPQMAFRLWFEQAAIADDIGDTVLRDKAVQWLNTHWRDASPKMLLSLYNWLKPREHVYAKAIYLHLYQREALEKVKEIANQSRRTNNETRRFIKSYLAPLRERSDLFLSPDAATLLLDLSDDPALVNIALHCLLTSNKTCWEQKAITYLLKAIARSILPPEDAVDFLLLDNIHRKKREQWLTWLLQSPDTIERRALLRALAHREAFPQILIRPGYWVYCDAGWGRIERILVGDEAQDLWIRDDTSQAQEVVLDIQLRAGAGPEYEEWARLDWRRKQIQLYTRPDNSLVKSAWRCRECGSFISQKEAFVREEHFKAAHGGICPSVQNIPLPYPWRPDQTVFSVQPPSNVFACDEEWNVTLQSTFQMKGTP